MTGKFKRILCIEHNYLGDLIAITPALRMLKENYPESKITLWVLPGYSDVLYGNPNIDAYIESPELINSDYDLLVVFHAGRIWHVYKVYERVKDIPYKIGVTNAGMLSSSFPALDMKVKYIKTQHIVEDNLDVIRLVCDKELKDKRYELYYRRTPEFYKYLNLNKGDKYILLHPGSKNIANLKNPSHWWPPEKWFSIAETFHKLGYKVFMSGTKDEHFIFLKIMNGQNPEIMTDMTGAFGLNQTKEFIANAKLLVSMDSGPVHIASAVDTPVISLMGPQDPVIWKPMGKNSYYHFHDNVCTKCKKLTCIYGKPKCMESITTEEVIRSAYALTQHPIK